MQTTLPALQGPMPDGSALANAIPKLSLPGMSSMVPSLSTSSKSGADGNVGGGLDAGHLLNEGDWIVSTGSAPAGLNTNTVIMVAAIGMGLWWMLKKKQS